MNATEFYKAGRLREAIEAQLPEVKASPTNHARRLFLFELLAFAGDLDRARKQLDAMNFGDPELDLAALAYRKLLDSEAARRRVFAGGEQPRFLGPVPEHAALRLEALECLRAGAPADAQAKLLKAADLVPPFTGTLQNQPFSVLRDCDDLFGPILEVMAQGAYFWVPLEQVVSLGMAPPRFPRDLLYFPAKMEMDEEAGDVFLPALYPNSFAHEDDLIKLGQSTDWVGAEGGPTQGVGSRVFLVDDDAVPLLDWRTYVRDEMPDAGAPDTPAEG